MSTYNVLLIGGGGREHALAWKIVQSPLLGQFHVAPGNAGTQALAQSVALSASDHDGIARFCRDRQIDLIVVGPEAPLVDGLVDHLSPLGLRVFGPDRFAAQLEGSKNFCKTLCQEHNIPTARFRHFRSRARALAYLEQHGTPVVIKADGLAAGKGVTIARTTQEAKEAIKRCFDGEFGAAGASLIMEEYLTGEEASFFVICDGKTAIPLATAQDHKQIGDGDRGANTGGMGAYSPVPALDDAMNARILKQIIEPTIAAMAARGHPYRGILYAGLMLGATGPRLIEYNVRFGDPECQVLMLRLKSDLLELMIAACDGTLANHTIEWHTDAALTVVMAASGYPGAYETGSVIAGVDEAAAHENVEIFHAATLWREGRLLANGGRVLNVTARGSTIARAQARAYEALSKIDWPEGYYRKDIGWRASADDKAP